MEIILDVTDLHIEFHDHDLPETVVEDFDLMLGKGEIVGIVGESGSGKSMSALAIAGLLNRHSMKKTGKIMFNGDDLLTCDRKKLRTYQGDEISIIFQEPMTSLNPVKKIGWQVEESLYIHHPMIGDPQILIADEPTTALDVTVQAQIVELLKKLNRERGTSIIFISHDLSLVRQLCQRVIVMQKGNIVETGNTESVFRNPKDPYTKKLIAAIPKIDLGD